MAQTSAASYGYNHAVAMRGQKADVSDGQIDTFAAEEAISFGVPLVKGTDAGTQVINAASSGDVWAGVSVLTQAIENSGFTSGVSGPPVHEIGAAVNVMRRGRIYVMVAKAVAVDDVAYADVSGADKTLFTDTSTSNLAVPGGKFMTAATTGGLAVLEFGY